VSVLIYRQGLEIHGAAADPEADSKYHLAAVHIAPDGAVTACDGRQWLRMRAAVDTEDLFTKQAAGELPAELPVAITVPADIAKAFLAASKRKAKKGQRAQQIVVAATGGQLTLATADGTTRRTFVMEPNDLPYPAFERTIPRGRPRVCVHLDVDAMLRLFTTLGRCGVGAVELRIHEADGPIRLTARTYIDDSEVMVDGVTMPLNAKNQEDDVPANVDRTTGEVHEDTSEAPARA